MVIIQIIFWLLAIYGLTQIIVETLIAKKVKEQIRLWAYYTNSNFIIFLANGIVTLCNCFLCTSVWIAALASFHWYTPSGELFDVNLLMNTFTDMMFGSAAVWFIHRFERILK